jgi:hypothetical protein
VEALQDERKETASAFMTRAIAWFFERGVRIERVLTDKRLVLPLSHVPCDACEGRDRAQADAAYRPAAQRQGSSGSTSR